MHHSDNTPCNGQPARSYQSRVASLCPRYPRLSRLSSFLASRARYPLGRIACLEFKNGAAKPTTTRELTLTELAHLVGKRDEGTICNRILIVEDLTREVIEILGSGLNVDPAFFAAHLHTSRMEESVCYAARTRALPSARKQEDFINISFPITTILEDADRPPPEKLKCCSNVRRKVGMLTTNLSRGSVVGIVSRKCTTLRVPVGRGAWLGLILVDPPIGNTFVYDNPYYSHSETAYFSRTRPSGGGSTDFSASSRDAIREVLPERGRPKNSMLEDLVFCWTRAPPPTFDPTSGDLLSLSYYPFKIAASELMAFANFMRFNLERYIYHLEANYKLGLEVSESDVLGFQAWRRKERLLNDSLCRNLGDIQRWNTEPCGVWSSVEEDYKCLIDMITTDDKLLDSITALMASLLQVSESRRSVKETVSLSRLTYLALFFVPLTYVTGLFSMSGNVAPGLPHFWVYFAVAVPVTIITFGVTMYFRRL